MFETLRIPIFLEGRIALEHAALLRDPVLRGDDVPRGDGRPVLLIPGFLAGDASLGTMASWLKRMGYRPCRARMRANVDCTTRGLERLETELEQLHDRFGRRVALVGQSRGGTMARLLAMRRPELVDSVVCLGSPLTDQMAIHPLVRVQVTAVGALGSLGVPGLFARSCQSGACCEEIRDQTVGEFPADIPYVSAYSKTDGIVDWRSCLDPAAECVEVGGSHVGMAVNARCYRVVADLLARSGASANAVAAA